MSEKVSQAIQDAEGFKQTVEKTYVAKNELSDELKKQATFIVSLTNDNHIIPTDSTGENGNYSGCETTISAVFGSELVTENCTFTQLPSQGITEIELKDIYIHCNKYDN